MTKVALVTGGTRGIGESISRALKDEGYTVVANYAGNESAARAFHEKTGIPVYKFDVAHAEPVEEALQKIEKDLAPIDILVANAGITRDGFLHKMTPQMWDDVIATNLTSLFHLSRYTITGMRNRGFGRVIAISSINGQKGQFGQVNYSAAKAGMIGFIKALAQEGAAKGITANAICPGYIATEMVASMPEEVLKSKIIPNIPVGRLGMPEEVARAVTFLSSEEAAFITGATLTVNGGQYMV